MDRRAIEPEALRLDGSAAGGTLSEVFASDLTAAEATCAGCGATGVVGALMVYGHGMGVVLRCPGCESVILRIARSPRHIYLDARGASRIVIPAS